MTLTFAVAIGACASRDVDKAGNVEPEGPTVLTMPRGGGAVLPPQLQPFVDGVNRLSEGTIRIDYDDNPGWRDGDPEQELRMIEAVQAGDVDIAWVGARVLDSFGVTSFHAVLAPFLVDSYELQDRVFEAGIPARMLTGVEEIGLVGVGVLPGPLRKLTGITHPFTTPADFAGAVFGTSGGELAEDAFRALGAVPQWVPSETSLDGLDGLDYQVGAVAGNRYYRTASHITANVNLWPRPYVLVMNAERFASLTGEQRDQLREAAAAAERPSAEVVIVGETEGKRAVCATDMRVVEATSADQDALAAAVEPVYAELETNPLTKAFLDEIRALKAQTDEPADSFECADDATPTVAAPTPIDGVYRSSTTVEELRAAGDPELYAENAGDLVFLFDRGRFVATIENDESCGAAYGTYVVEGDRIELFRLDDDGPGQHFTYGWSRYRDTLTLSAVPGAVSPVPLMVKPWRRTDEAPSLDVFAERCPPPPEALG